MKTRQWARSVVVATVVLAVAAIGGPARAGAGNNDITGDGRADLMAMYDYGGGEAALFAVPGTARIEPAVTEPYAVWRTPWPGNYWPSVTKATSGDFNGDGRSDFLSMYDYGNGEAGLWVFSGSGGQPYRVWHTPRGNFWLSAMKITSADFNDDGLADVLAMYDYGDESAGLWVFPGTRASGDAASNPYMVWETGPGGFDVNRAKIAGGDFNLDGRDDLVALYDYGNSEAGLWVFPGTPNAGPSASNPYMVWNVPPGHFNVGAVRHTDIDDINDDGIVDFIAITETVVNRFSGTTGSGGQATIGGEYSTIPVAYGRGKMIVGDYDGNGVTDIIFLRDDGQEAMSIGVLRGGIGVNPPRLVDTVGRVGPGSYSLNAMTVA